MLDSPLLSLLALLLAIFLGQGWRARRKLRPQTVARQSPRPRIGR